MLRAILNKSWSQHPTKQQLYGHLTPITKTIQVRRTRHAGHCWRSRDELISDVLLWTPSHCRAKVRRPARTYIQQLCKDTTCSFEDLPEAMNEGEKWRDRGSGISVLVAWHDDDDDDEIRNPLLLRVGPACFQCYRTPENSWPQVDGVMGGQANGEIFPFFPLLYISWFFSHPHHIIFFK